MNDFISRSHFEKEIKSMVGTIDDVVSEDFLKGVKAILALLQYEQSVKCDKWITGRLPDKDGWYLATFDSKFFFDLPEAKSLVGMCEFSGGGWVDKMRDIHAWMPMPAAYEE